MRSPLHKGTFVNASSKLTDGSLLQVHNLLSPLHLCPLMQRKATRRRHISSKKQASPQQREVGFAQQSSEGLYNQLLIKKHCKMIVKQSPRLPLHKGAFLLFWLRSSSLYWRPFIFMLHDIRFPNPTQKVLFIETPPKLPLLKKAFFSAVHTQIICWSLIKSTANCFKTRLAGSRKEPL